MIASTADTRSDDREPSIQASWDGGDRGASGGSGNSDTIRITVSGTWNIREHSPDFSKPLDLIGSEQTKQLVLAADNLGRWDTSLVACLTELVRAARKRKLDVTRDDSLPEGVGNLLDLALAIPPNKDEKSASKQSFLEHIGEMASAIPAKALDVVSFIGEITISFGRMLTGRAVIRAKDVWGHLYQASVGALPIVALISLLVGLILAFVGVVQLRMFGAEIYVSSLVAIGMTRIMGAIMTGIVLAGRTGASYAAIIGSMQVNEEVDALQSLGISPVDYLVMPRLIALAIMTPLLVLYSDFMGIVGGFIVGSVVLDIDALEYITFTRRALKYSHLVVGVIHGFAFGIVVAVAGCYQGLRSGKSAEAVGTATTSAVVNAIVFIIIVTAILTVLFNAIGV